MTTATTARTAPRLLPAGLQLGAAACALALVAAGWLGAGRESHAALQSSVASLGTLQHVTLPAVTIVGHREASQVASVACATRGQASL